MSENMFERHPLLTVAARLLMALKAHGPQSQIELTKSAKVAASAARYNLELLREMGLVKEERAGTFPFKILYSLTEKGEKVAELLEQLKRLLESP